MIKVIIKDKTPIAPFAHPDHHDEEYASNLTILNKRLWLLQRDTLRSYCEAESEYDDDEPIKETDEETFIYRDNLFFDEHLIRAFFDAVRERNTPSQIAFSKDDKAIIEHALPLQSGIRLQGDVYVADMFYYPQGYSKEKETLLQPVVIDTKPEELGYYRVPYYMAKQSGGDLIYQVPQRPFLSIENWVHVFLANTAFGIYSQGKKIEAKLDSIPFMMKVFVRSLLEGKQFLESSPLVIRGKNCEIDPAAIIQGPTILGDNVSVGPGAVVNSCIIGDNVTISQGCQLMVSVVGSGTFLPFRAALFMTTLMENVTVAQNTCLQLCVIGRNTFIGAGNTFTDYNLLTEPLRTMHQGQLAHVEQPVIGGGVGHNCRIGSGHIFFPGRTVQSGVIRAAQDGRLIVRNNITYDETDYETDFDT